MAKALYIGIDSKARKGKKAYIGVDGVAKKVKKMYIGVNGVARLFWSGGNEPTKIIIDESTQFNGYYGIYERSSDTNAPDGTYSESIDYYLKRVDNGSTKQVDGYTSDYFTTSAPQTSQDPNVFPPVGYIKNGKYLIVEQQNYSSSSSPDAINERPVYLIPYKSSLIETSSKTLYKNHIGTTLVNQMDTEVLNFLKNLNTNYYADTTSVNNPYISNFDNSLIIRKMAGSNRNSGSAVYDAYVFAGIFKKNSNGAFEYLGLVGDSWLYNNQKDDSVTKRYIAYPHILLSKTGDKLLFHNSNKYSLFFWDGNEYKLMSTYNEGGKPRNVTWEPRVDSNLNYVCSKNEAGKYNIFYLGDGNFTLIKSNLEYPAAFNDNNSCAYVSVGAKTKDIECYKLDGGNITSSGIFTSNHSANVYVEIKYFSPNNQYCSVSCSQGGTITNFIDKIAFTNTGLISSTTQKVELSASTGGGHQYGSYSQSYTHGGFIGTTHSW